MASCSTPTPSPSGPGVPVPTTNPYSADPLFPGPGVIGPQPEGMPLHACMGLNACAGSDRFGVLGAPGKQPNACAGQGYCSTGADHTCHVQNDCKGQGGCGLYGTATEMMNPGNNACRSQGSCATPINAERFSTNGPNQGKSVWLQARKVFEDNWAATQAELKKQQAAQNVAADQPLPATLGTPPAAFAATGPTYLWISKENNERGNMTACGSSGMSGAGGCS